MLAESTGFGIEVAAAEPCRLHASRAACCSGTPAGAPSRRQFSWRAARLSHRAADFPTAPLTLTPGRRSSRRVRAFPRSRRRFSCPTAAACPPPSRPPVPQPTFPPRRRLFPLEPSSPALAAIESPAPASSGCPPRRAVERPIDTRRDAPRARTSGGKPIRRSARVRVSSSRRPRSAIRSARRRRALERPSSFAQRMARSMLLRRAVASQPRGARDSPQSSAGNQSAAGCRGRR
jgi:hypothetical protein